MIKENNENNRKDENGEKDIILSIETAISGGSLSLLRHASELDFWIGSDKVSKSIDILDEIQIILKKNNLRKTSIKKIVVSDGPGSRTGIRVGAAVAFGLRRALGCELTVISCLEAMCLNYRIEEFSRSEKIITAVPVGENQIVWQEFETNDQEQSCQIPSQNVPFQISTIENFIEFQKKNEAGQRRTLVLHSKLYLRLKIELTLSLKDNYCLIDAGENIAGINGSNEKSFVKR